MNSQGVQFSEAQQRVVDRLTLQWVEILCRVDRHLTGPEAEEMEMAFYEDWITRPDGTVHIAVIDSETTSLDPGTAEVIGLGVLCVRVDRASGQMLSIVRSAFGWQEPKSYPPAAEAVTGLAASRLVGCPFDRPRIKALLSQSDLVVVRHAGFERPFLEPLFPQLAELRFACALHDIEWRNGQKMSHPSINGLLNAYRLGSSDKTPEGDCHALVKILSQPLLISPETGFRCLIAASSQVTIDCAIPDADTAAEKHLWALGFCRKRDRLVLQCEDAAHALALETRVIDLAVGHPAFQGLRMWRVDAVGRFRTAVGTSLPA